MTYLRAMAAVVAASSEEVGMLNRLTQLLYGVAQVMIPPDPTPNAPAEVKARAIVWRRFSSPSCSAGNCG